MGDQHFLGGVCEALIAKERDTVAKATADGGWDNQIVRDLAPDASIINKFITPRAVITTSMEDSDLVYIIRASQINK